MRPSGNCVGILSGILYVERTSEEILGSHREVTDILVQCRRVGLQVVGGCSSGSNE